MDVVMLFWVCFLGTRVDILDIRIEVYNRLWIVCIILLHCVE